MAKAGIDQTLLMIVHVGRVGEFELADVGEALGGAGGLSCRGEAGEEEADEERDDGDDDEEFDEGEGGGGASSGGLHVRLSRCNNVSYTTVSLYRGRVMSTHMQSNGNK